MNDPAFQSQQFADQVQARREQHVIGQGEAINRGLTGAAEGFMRGREHALGMAQGQQAMTIQAQQHQMEMQRVQQAMDMQRAQVGSELAYQEVERQRATDELMWARELHTTDILAAQARAIKAQSELAIAKMNKEREDLGKNEWHGGALDEYVMNSVKAAGWTFDFSSGRPVVTKADDETISGAKKWMDNHDAGTRFDMSTALQAASQGYVRDMESGGWKQDAEAAQQFIDNAAKMRQRLAGGKSDREVNIQAAHTALTGLMAQLKIASAQMSQEVQDSPGYTSAKANVENIENQITTVLNSILSAKTEAAPVGTAGSPEAQQQEANWDSLMRGDQVKWK